MVRKSNISGCLRAVVVAASMLALTGCGGSSGSNGNAVPSQTGDSGSSTSSGVNPSPTQYAAGSPQLWAAYSTVTETPAASASVQPTYINNGLFLDSTGNPGAKPTQVADSVDIDLGDGITPVSAYSQILTTPKAGGIASDGDRYLFYSKNNQIERIDLTAAEPSPVPIGTAFQGKVCALQSFQSDAGGDSGYLLVSVVTNPTGDFPCAATRVNSVLAFDASVTTAGTNFENNILLTSFQSGSASAAPTWLLTQADATTGTISLVIASDPADTSTYKAIAGLKLNGIPVDYSAVGGDGTAVFVTTGSGAPGVTYRVSSDGTFDGPFNGFAPTTSDASGNVYQLNAEIESEPTPTTETVIETVQELPITGVATVKNLVTRTITSNGQPDEPSFVQAGFVISPDGKYGLFTNQDLSNTSGTGSFLSQVSIANQTITDFPNDRVILLNVLGADGSVLAAGCPASSPSTCDRQTMSLYHVAFASGVTSGVGNAVFVGQGIQAPLARKLKLGNGAGTPTVDYGLVAASSDAAGTCSGVPAYKQFELLSGANYAPVDTLALPSKLQACAVQGLFPTVDDNPAYMIEIAGDSNGNMDLLAAATPHAGSSDQVTLLAQAPDGASGLSLVSLFILTNNITLFGF